MEDVPEIETIDVELDDFIKRKPVSRCRDEFLNILCGDDDEDGITIENEGASGSHTQQEIVQADNEKESDTDTDFEYATHNPETKWNVMQPIQYERYESPHQLKLCLTTYAISKGHQIRFRKCDSMRLIAVCASKETKCPWIVRAS